MAADIYFTVQRRAERLIDPSGYWLDAW